MSIEDDDRDWTLDELAEREPDEPDPEPAPTVEQIEGALAAYQRGQDPFEVLDPAERSDADQAADFLLDRAVPQLLADLADARERLARYEGVPTRGEWTVTADAATPPDRDAWFYTADAALKIAAGRGLQAWRRVVTQGPVVVRPWEPIATEPPF